MCVTAHNGFESLQFKAFLCENQLYLSFLTSLNGFLAGKQECCIISKLLTFNLIYKLHSKYYK